MKTTINKVLCLLLVLVMSFVVIGCKGDKTDPATTTGGGGPYVPPTDDGTEFPYEIRNWAGKQLNIATTQSSSDSFFTKLCGEETLGYEVHDAIFSRDAHMYETFGIDVFYIPYSSDNNGKQLLETVSPLLKKNTYICDMINAGLKGCLLNMYATNLLYDINSMPLIDMENDWWASYFAEGATYNNKLYYIAGMVAGGGYFSTPYVLACNTNLQRDVYLADGTQMDIFSLIEDGKWTIATMADIVTDYAKDLTGNGYNVQEDRMAFLHVGGGIVTGGCHFIGAGGKFCTTTEDGDLNVYNHLLTQENQNLVKDLQNLFAIVAADNCYGVEFESDPFTNDRALFMGNSMTLVEGLTAMESDYAIIPCPKSNSPAQTEYFSGVNTWTQGFTAFATNLSDAEFVAYAAEALGWLSYHEVRPEVYDATLCLRLVREDERQIDIMDIIFANLYIDLNYLNEFGNSVEKMCNAIYKNQNYYNNIYKLDRAIQFDMDDFLAGIAGE